jgi:Tol biopolymer transport system component
MIVDTVTGSQTAIGPDYQYGYVFRPSYSPSGNKLAFAWIIWQDTVATEGDSITSGIWVMSLDDSSLTKVYSRSLPLGWSEDGEYLYFWLNRSKVVKRLSISTNEIDTILVLPDDGVEHLAMSNDTRSFVYPKLDGADDVWLIEKE